MTRFAAATPLKTELRFVLRIELFVVDKDEIPKVIAVPPFSTVAISLP